MCRGCRLVGEVWPSPAEIASWISFKLGNPHIVSTGVLGAAFVGEVWLSPAGIVSWIPSLTEQLPLWLYWYLGNETQLSSGRGSSLPKLY